VEVGGGGLLLLSQAIARRTKILPNPKGNRTSAGEEGDGGLGRKRKSKRGRKCSFRPQWGSAFIDSTVGFHRDWLESMTPPQISQLLCERPNLLLLAKKNQSNKFFVVVSWF